MAVIYDGREAELFFNGEKVDAGITNLVYGPPRPSMAEYLARREKALDWLSQWRANGVPVAFAAIMRAQSVVGIALEASKLDRWPSTSPQYQAPPRDKTPLPLP